MDNFNNYGDIFVIYYKNHYFSVDGHHRLFYLYKLGIKKIDVIMEISDNDSPLYQVLADEALDLKFTDISSLEDRILTDHKDYEDKWINKCQGLLKNHLF